MSPSGNLLAVSSATTAPAGLELEADETVFAFGDYLLFPRRRQLLTASKPVKLGSRAFDAFLALVEAEGRLVTKEQLIRRVWHNITVEEKNLSVQIAAIRKALGDNRELVKTDAGRGYRFAGMARKIVREQEKPAVVDMLGVKPRQSLPTNIPIPLFPLLGREEELEELGSLVLKHRLVTLTGVGGIGKTQLGLEIARQVRSHFGDGAWVVDLGPLADAELVGETIAATLGIDAIFDRTSTGFSTALGQKHMLLVLDNCEHVIEAAARSAEMLLRGIHRLHVIATSREPLAAEGEHVYRVAPLKIPPKNVRNVAEALEHSAVQLFVDRAGAADPRLVFEDADVPFIVKICRGLDGIPLAIELAAANTPTAGLDALAARIDSNFDLLAGGRRTALPRHRTLRATLDWSYDLLDAGAQAVFHRLAIFVGGFSLESAAEVVAIDPVGDLQSRRYISELVRKSLVAMDVHGTVARYRLLETTRIYARQKLSKSGELAVIAQRHVAYYREMLEKAAPEWQTTPAPQLIAKYAPEIDNIRAALNWAFASEHGPRLGIALTVASVPLWMLLSMLAECQDLVARALGCLSDGLPDGKRYEMLLQSALGTASLWTKGPTKTAFAASERVRKLGEELNDHEYQLCALYVQWVYRLRAGEYRTSLAIAEQMRRAADAARDLPGALTGARLEGVSLHYLGDQARAREIMEHVARQTASNVAQAFIVRFGLDQRCAALVYLARILWLQGFPEQAQSTAEMAIADAVAINHVNSLGIVLNAACGVAAMCGDLKATQKLATKVIEGARKNGLGIWQVYGLAFQGWIAIKRGAADKGVPLLQAALNDFRETRIELRHTIFIEALAEALTRCGRMREATIVVNDVLCESRNNEGHWCLPELLRIRAELLLAEDAAGALEAAEEMLQQALASSRQSGARAWELRVAMSLGRLWRDQSRNGSARDLLSPIYESFTEGRDTADVKAARALMESLK